MISGAHVVLFTPAAEATREFLRDVLGLSSVDAGGGWLIFALPSAEVAIHPAEHPSHELYLMCDDLEATMANLAGAGATFGPVSRGALGACHGHDYPWRYAAPVDLPTLAPEAPQPRLILPASTPFNSPGRCRDGVAIRGPPSDVMWATISYPRRTP